MSAVDATGPAEALLGPLLRPLFAWARRKSRVGLGVVGALPGAELAAWQQPRLLPIGVPTDAPHPRQADLLVVVGRISHKLAPFLVRAHAAMARPAQVLVIELEPERPAALRTYASVDDIQSILPVDVLLRSAAPRQERVAAALAALDARWSTARPAASAGSSP